jgi:hypothetical protein
MERDVERQHEGAIDTRIPRLSRAAHRTGSAPRAGDLAVPMLPVSSEPINDALALPSRRTLSPSASRRTLSPSASRRTLRVRRTSCVPDDARLRTNPRDVETDREPTATPRMSSTALP